MRIKADRGVCVGAGQCVLTEPAVFDQGDDGLVVLLDEAPEGARAEAARTAVDLCPSGALSLVED
ncbi:MAG TPA: (4Fe-4S)-binding protein [Pseudonocardiaceae bacterium]|jgi:ferredoxin